jgi:hypothetical protein
MDAKLHDIGMRAAAECGMEDQRPLDVHDHLRDWITHPGMETYHGRGYTLRNAVLAAVVRGGNISDVAREYKVSQQFANRLARRARSIFLNAKKLGRCTS